MTLDSGNARGKEWEGLWRTRIELLVLSLVWCRGSAVRKRGNNHGSVLGFQHLGSGAVFVLRAAPGACASPNSCSMGFHTLGWSG